MSGSARGWAGAVLVALAAAGCGGGDQEDDAGGGRDAAAGADFRPTDGGGVPDMEKLAEQQRNALKELNAGKEIQAVEPAAIKALVPPAIAGAKRRNVETQRIHQMGMDIATTKCDFEPEEDPNDDGSNPKPSYRLEITDVGNMTGAYSMAFASWATISVDKETETGWEKTGRYRGNPCWEEYDNSSKSGSMKVLVAKRFIVDLHGNDCSMDQIKAAVDALDVSKLEALVK